MNTVTLVGHLDTEPVSRIVAQQPLERIRPSTENHAAPAPVTVNVDVWGNHRAADEGNLTRGRLVGVVDRPASSIWRDDLSNRRQHVFVITQASAFPETPQPWPALLASASGAL